MRKIQEPPQIGDERLIQRFLWLPLTLNGERRWLTSVIIRQIYKNSRVQKQPEVWRIGWRDGQFED